MTHAPGWPPQQPHSAPAPVDHGGSFVRVHLQGSMWTSSIATPSIMVNGYPVPASYGEKVIPVYPGPTTVSAKAQWLREYGQAAYTVDVAPGQVVDVWYAAPWTQFQTGSMGPVKQRRKGGGLLLGLLGGLLLLFVGLPLVVSLTS